jgi:hypothetical protein
MYCQLLSKYTANDKVKKVSIKRVGELCTEAWAAACQQKFKYNPEGWQTHMAKMISDWDATLSTHEFHPFKMVQVGNNVWEVHFYLI